MSRSSEVRYFADANAAPSRAVEERKAAMFMGLARWGMTPEDTVAVMAQKRLAAHLSVACAAELLLSLATWTNPIAIIVFAISSVFAVAVGLALLWVNKDHAPLRWVTVGGGLLFAIIFMASEGCMPVTRSQGRYLGMILPTVLFNVSMGGAITLTILGSATHVCGYVIFSIVEGVSGVPCHTSEISTISNVLGVVAFQVFVPWVITLIAGTATMYGAVVSENHFEDTEELAAVVAQQMDCGNFEGARALAEAHVERRGEGLLASDIALSTAVGHAANFAEMVPSTLRRPSSQAQGVSAGRGFVAFHDGDGHSPRNDDGGATSTPEMGDGEVAAPQGGSFKKHASSPNVTRQQSVRRLSATDVAVRRPSSTTLERRRSSLRQMYPISKSKSFLVSYSLPRLEDYLLQPRANPDMAKLILSQYMDIIQDLMEQYGGTVLFAAFSDVYCTFETCGAAAAASLSLKNRMQAESAHHRDQTVMQTQPGAVFAVIIHAEILHGMIGSNMSEMKMMGWSAGEHVLSKVKYFMAHTVATPPIILMAGSLQFLLEGDFVFSSDNLGDFVSVLKAVETDEHGSPRLHHSKPREAEINHERVFDIPDVDNMMRQLIEGLQGMEETEEGSQLGNASMSNDPTGDAASESASMQRTASLRRVKTVRKRLDPQVLELWERFDADRSGYLDHMEIKDLLAELGIFMTEQELRDFYDEVDRDKNGQITLDEFAKSFTGPNIGGANAIASVRKAAAAMQRTGVDNMPLVVNVWKKYDSDGNGTLDPNEVFSVLKDLGITQSEEEVGWLVNKLDVNGSGTVEFEEFASLFSEEHTDMKLNLVRQRIQAVARVMENRASQEVFTTEDQTYRETLVAMSHRVDTFYSPILVLYIAYVFGYAFYRLAMQGDIHINSDDIVADMVLDLIYVAWFVLKLAFIPREVDGQIVFLRKDVLQVYCKSPEFFVDLLVVLPIDFIYIGIWDEAISGHYAYYRVNKILALYHLDDLFVKSIKRFSPVIVRITDGLMWFIVVSHVFASAVIFLARQVGEAKMFDMVGTPTLISDESTRYLLAFLWASQTLAGQLRGEALPPEDAQLYLMLVAMLVGLPIFAALLGVIGNSLNVESTETNFLRRVDTLRSYFTYAKNRMSAEEAATLETECVRYYRHLFETTGSLDILANPLVDVPAELLIQVTVETGLEMLRKVPIFKEACENVEFVHELTIKLIPRVVEPGVIVMRKGDRGSNMYFITYGDFNIVVDGVGVVFTLRKGNFFGEIALLHNVKRTATIQCDQRRYANVLTLEKRDFDEVMETFPQCLSAISKAAEERLKGILEQEAEEARKQKEIQRQAFLQAEKEREEREAAEREVADAKVDDKSSEPGGRQLSSVTATPQRSNLSRSPAPSDDDHDTHDRGHTPLASADSAALRPADDVE